MGYETFLLFVVGIVALVAGAELLVRGASRIAIAVGISPLVVGLTVVAMGTSSPELAVSVGAVMKDGGSAGIALGNVVGSNIFNVLFILGLSAVVTPLVVHAALIRRDVPVMIGASVLVWFFARDGALTRVEGAILFALVVPYIAFLIVESRREAREKGSSDAPVAKPSPMGVVRDVAFIVVGLVFLVLGADWLVSAAVTVAKDFGVSDVVIGLTIVAGGTSLPEVAASVMASLKGERDIAVGNVVGSNILNIMLVLGPTVVIAGHVEVDAGLAAFDVPVMIAVAVACLPIFFIGSRVSRGEGALFLGYYVAYTTVLVFRATSHPQLGSLSNALLYFALPLTVLTLAIFVVREWRARRS